MKYQLLYIDYIICRLFSKMNNLINICVKFIQN